MRLTADILVRAYARGFFPMSEDRDDPELFWVDPDRRGVLPLETFHVSRRLARTVRQERFAVSVDRAFPAVIAACAAPRPGRTRTWINDEIEQAYVDLARRGIAHSVECWLSGDLVGGLYGVALGGAFFGESMFSRATDASKVALVHLVARLKAGGFRLLDCQFITDHLRQFGTVEIPREDYKEQLIHALAARADFYRFGAAGAGDAGGAAVLQSITQTS